MCIEKEKLNELCELFPITHENLKNRSLIRRNKFMIQKRENSKTYKHALENMDEDQKKEQDSEKIPFMYDEDPEDLESQKEDMKVYLDKLNRKIELLVGALKHADDQMKSVEDDNCHEDISGVFKNKL